MDTFDCRAECLRATDKAILVKSADLGDDPLWIPQSVVTADSEVYRTGDVGTLHVQMWFAEQKGWL